MPFLCLMAVNKLALLRYNTIDKCLSNRYRQWTLNDLIQKVSEALYEQEGISSGVSKRTIQADLELMRSNKLGYNAPIVVLNRKFYTYEDARYSIHRSRVTPADMEKMNEMVSVLQQMSGFDYFKDMTDIMARLQNSLQNAAGKSPGYIQLENNHRLKGIEHVGPLYQAILKKIPLLIRYQSFQQTEPREQVYHPYLLKEYRNRWFLLCRPRQSQHLLTLALDRMIDFMEMSPRDFVPYEGVDFERYYADCIGVTKNSKDRPQKVILKVDKETAPYVLTKPIHHSQQLLHEEETGIIIRIDVVLNFELERELLGFGECIEVKGPLRLKKRMSSRLERAARQYRNV